jgi:hypothetical protein
MSIKFYAKKGKRNYKEVRLIKELQPFIDQKLQQNPELAENFRPATNFEELEALHRQYVSEEVDYEEISEKQNNNRSMAKEKVETNDDKDFFKQIDESNDDSDFVDPFNREEPIVRDYVTGGGLKDDSIPEGPVRTTFDEPLTFKDAFELPSDENTEEPKGKQAQTQSEPKREKPRQQRSEPLNPSFDEMSTGKKKRSTKKFAKYIVETICMLSERGFIWYATKDINEAKLAEYELNGEMDLSLLINLDNGQEATIKQFFTLQCDQAEQLARFEQEKKDDLADALAEVLLEKGVGPTPMQELMLIAAQVLGEKVIVLMTMKSQQNGLMAQLRAMNEGRQQPRYQEPAYTPPADPVVETESVIENEPEQEISNFDFSSLEVEEPNELEIEDVVETKE